MLFVAEKPSLGKALSSALGGVTSRDDGYFKTGSGDMVTWCFGHLFEQANPEDYDASLKSWQLESLPIVPEVWRLNPRADAKKQIDVIRGLLKKADCVVNAGDPDREGQLLVDQVLEECGYSGRVQRIWLQDLTENGIKSALANVQPNTIQIYQGMKDSALARSRADWLIGMNLTRACTLKGRDAGHDGVLSVGRVQTPTLALVVARDLAIEQFKPVPFYGVSARWDTGFSSQWQPSEEITDSEGRCLKRADADAVVTKIKGQKGLVKQAEYKARQSAPPLPFSLSGLQSEASAKFGMGAQAVLDTAQSLYEKHKLTSYPRTDCGYLAEGQHRDSQKVLNALGGMDGTLSGLIGNADKGRKSAAFNDQKITAHTGIIPTGEAADLKVLSKPEKQVFDLIARRYIMQFYGSAVYNEAKVKIEIEGETFTSSGKVLLDAGWRVCLDKTDNDTEIPKVKEGQSLVCTEATREDKKTTPAQRYSEGSLIKAMAGIAKLVENPKLKAMLKETSGIGTEATRAGVIETLKKRNFIAVKGKTLVSTDTGRGLIKALPDEVTSAEMTALWELWLDEVATGKMSLEVFIQKQTEFVTGLVKELKSDSSKMKALGGSLPDCPKCKKSKLKPVSYTHLTLPTICSV